jgi:hypothetical protein
MKLDFLKSRRSLVFSQMAVPVSECLKFGVHTSVAGRHGTTTELSYEV